MKKDRQTKTRNHKSDGNSRILKKPQLQYFRVKKERRVTKTVSMGRRKV